MNTIQLQEQDFEKEVPTLALEAQNFIVSNDRQYHEAVERANICKAKLNAVIEFFRPLKESTHKAWKDVLAKENMFAPRLESAKKLYTQKAADYQLKKQREQEEKERIAREKAEAIENKRKADIQAKIDEENKKIEDARKAEEKLRAEEAAKIKATKDKAARETMELEAEERRKVQAIKDEQARVDALQKTEKLEEKKDTVYVSPRSVQQAPRASGLSVHTVWEAIVTDESKVPLTWWSEIDLGRLKRAKTADKTLEVPGIKFVERAQGSARGK